MGINHRSPYIAVPKKRLDCPYVVIGLKQMSCKTVTESVGRDSFSEFGAANSLVKRFLDMLFMHVIPALLLRIRHKRQRLLRKEPLPDKVLCRFRIFLFKLIIQKYTRKTLCHILIMEFFYRLKLLSQFKDDLLRYRHCPALIAFSSDRENSGVKIEILHPQLHTFKETETGV